MTTIAAIHGSLLNAASWDLVKPFFEQAGHSMIAVELPPDRPDFTARAFARVAAEQIPDDCVVVAHDTSCMLLPYIVELRRVQAVVYLAPVVEPGILPDANWRDVADRLLFNDVLLSVREWAYTTIRPMRIDRLFEEPFVAAEVNSVWLSPHRDQIVPRDRQRRVGIELGLSGGHCPQISTPRETASNIMFACDSERFARAEERIRTGAGAT